MNNYQIIDTEKSNGFFSTSFNNDAIKYLEKAQCPKTVLELFSSGLQGFALENSFFFDGVELGVDYFLGTSENDVYDIIDFNETYNQRRDYVVLGVLQGGDTFGFVKGNDEIYLNLDTTTNFDDIIFARMSENIFDFLTAAFEQ